MSQFDYPRINFSGYARINPATANNNILLPLVLFDPLKVTAILPPRIYCTGNFEISLRLGTVKLPDGCNLETTETGETYFKIAPVNNAELFAQWATSPLGSSDIDSDYHALYDIVRTVRGNEPLKGKTPAAWNYYGGMEFEFIDVKTTSVEIENNALGRKKFTPASSEIPPSIADILEGEITLKDEKGRNTAVIIDVMPGIAFYSQIFCDSFRLIAKEKTWMKGKPKKASLRFLNPNRVLNLQYATGSSGSFYSAIPASEFKGENAGILDFFEANGIHPEEIQGAFIRYNLFEVTENENPDYSKLGKSPNPATSRVVGSITPWYKSDQRSMVDGRLMLPEKSVDSAQKVGGFLFRLDKLNHKLLLDFGGSIPQWKNNEENRFITNDLGTLVFGIESNDQIIELGRLEVNEEKLSFRQWEDTGGLLEIPMQLPSSFDLEELLVSVFLKKKNDPSAINREDIIMQESEWAVYTDTAGLYINQTEDPELGYRSYSHIKEPCRIDVYRLGKPWTQPLPMCVLSFDVKSSAAAADIQTYISTDAFLPGVEMHFPTTSAANRMYIFYPGATEASRKEIIDHINRTGFFLNLRVLPKQNYDKYLDPNHPEFPTPIPFDLIYKELLEVSHLIYPWSSMITPFTESYFTKGWKFIQSRLKPENWNSYTYMPSSRDMSDNLYKLICKWGEDLGNSEGEIEY